MSIRDYITIANGTMELLLRGVAPLAAAIGGELLAARDVTGMTLSV